MNNFLIDLMVVTVILLVNIIILYDTRGSWEDGIAQK